MATFSFRMFASRPHPRTVIAAVPELASILHRAMHRPASLPRERWAISIRPKPANPAPARVISDPSGRSTGPRSSRGTRENRFATPTTSRRLAPVTRAHSPSGQGQRSPDGHRPIGIPYPLGATGSAGAAVENAKPRPFSSYGLPSYLTDGLSDLLGNSNPQTTPIQSLSLSRAISRPIQRSDHGEGYLLGAETGSGKTLAYLVPLMMGLKQSEAAVLGRDRTVEKVELGSPAEHDAEEPAQHDGITRPRSLILSPTHELTRQSTSVAKTLAHSVKLRVRGLSSTRYSAQLEGAAVDMLFGTSGSIRKLLGLSREGIPWAESEPRLDAVDARPLSLEKVEWVVVDEADVLLGPDFVSETTAILSRIPPSAHMALCTATLPPSLLAAISSSAALSSTTRPNGFTHLMSPGMHQLPPGLKTKFVGDTGGNLPSSVVREVKDAFTEDALGGAAGGRSRAVVFCNTDNRVRQISRKFEEKGFSTIPWTSAGIDEAVSATGTTTARQRGKQGALGAFLTTKSTKMPVPSPGTSSGPRVLVTTSLLSRGLDFSADVSTVILVDPPRDALDFVHRAGRTGRAGRKGRVIVFGMGGKAGDIKGYTSGRNGRSPAKRVGVEVSKLVRRR